jgi:putative DNA primase/helicase
MSRDLFQDWRYRADQADLLETANRYGAKLRRVGRENIGPCPACGGTDRFSINQLKFKWHCRGHGGGHGAISLTMHIGHLSFLQACEDLTGEPNPTGVKSQPLTEEQQAERNRQRQQNDARAAARKAAEIKAEDNSRHATHGIWDASGSLSGPAEAYLARRGFAGFTDPALRFHPGLSYPGEQGKFPALICRVDDISGQLTGIWREYLSRDGNKAPFEYPKLGLGPCAGGAVRLGGIGRHIGAAEGVFSALGAHFLIGKRYPVWAALSTSGLIGFEIPMQVERLTLFPDGDAAMRKRGEEYEPAVPAGRKAVASLRNRAIQEGVGCDIAAEPSAGLDYANLWAERCREIA